MTGSDNVSDAYWEKPKRLTTWSGIPVKSFYGPQDVAHINYEREMGDPGEYPTTRGIYRDMYRGRLWTRRLQSGFGTAEDTNARLKFEMQQGPSGLGVFLDYPSMHGIDADHPLSDGEVGQTGYNYTFLEDMRVLLDDIPIDKVSMVLNSGGVASTVTLGAYTVVAQERQLDLTKLRGTVSNEPVDLRFINAYRPANPLDLAIKFEVDVMEFCARRMPLFYTGFSNGYNLREAGRITAAQEVAFTLAQLLAPIKAALERGLDIDDVAPRRTSYFAVDIDFFEEIAKLRAARRMWARLIKDKYGAKKPDSWKLKIAAHTAGSSTWSQQPLNNIVRVAYEALAAVLAGVQSLHCVGYDEPVGHSTELAHMLSVRTQQILAYETGVVNVADPLGGSYYVESLTSKIEEEATKIFDEIERKGGWMAQDPDKFIQDLEDSALRFHREVESGERTVVGVNMFTVVEETETPGGVLVLPKDAEERQLARVRRIRETRDADKWREALTRLEERARMGDKENLMPPIIEAVKANASIGEILGTIRQVYGHSYDPFGILESPLGKVSA